MNLEHIQELIDIVPQNFGEALQLYPWLECPGHEWDNRTTIQNSVWLIEQLNARIKNQQKEIHEFKTHCMETGEY